MTSDGKSTEWLDLMLGELELRRRERREAEEEAAQREAIAGAASGNVNTGRPGKTDGQSADGRPTKPQGK